MCWPVSWITSKRIGGPAYDLIPTAYHPAGKSLLPFAGKFGMAMSQHNGTPGYVKPGLAFLARASRGHTAYPSARQIISQIHGDGPLEHGEGWQCKTAFDARSGAPQQPH